MALSLRLLRGIEKIAILFGTPQGILNRAVTEGAKAETVLSRGRLLRKQSVDPK